MANSVIKCLSVIEGTITDTTDENGRISIPIHSNSKCLSIRSLASNCIVFGTKVDGGNANKTLVYFKDAFGNEWFRDKSVSIKYSYIVGGG